ncbi:hypothetical protein [Pelagovum pacificum]|uniref:Uncharacterized protein n=1 Tax=Pelagovum pacificum TaxID=2588711 RepID=A0A5C5G9T8_9RHOB|nr:hypothetical protein [Pelagovum pacificum]QQA42452.1 hypothetical protein I8N54_16935 [Pelagovum pacificum]TNY31535.1 hypothetical protein FHY64_16125 [Pelagovum pacificum]
MSKDLIPDSQLDALVPEDPTGRDRLMPVLVAGGLLAAGALLLRVDPGSAQVPSPARYGDAPRGSRFRRAAQASRDTIAPLAPSNLTDSIGRSLVIGGAALILTRFFDELVGRSRH